MTVLTVHNSVSYDLHFTPYCSSLYCRSFTLLRLSYCLLHHITLSPILCHLPTLLTLFQITCDINDPRRKARQQLTVNLCHVKYSSVVPTNSRTDSNLHTSFPNLISNYHLGRISKTFTRFKPVKQFSLNFYLIQMTKEFTQFRATTAAV